MWPLEALARRHLPVVEAAAPRSECKRLLHLPEDIGLLRVLTHLNLSKCTSLLDLPDEIGTLTELERLDLSYCSHLSSVPSLHWPGMGLCSLNIDGLPGLPKDLKRDDPGRWLFAKKVCWLLGMLKRNVAVGRLATQQGSMVTSLERMSSLVVLLATATFIAYLQPPGSFEENSHMVRSGNLTSCDKYCNLRVPSRRGRAPCFIFSSWTGCHLAYPSAAS